MGGRRAGRWPSRQVATRRLSRHIAASRFSSRQGVPAPGKRSAPPCSGEEPLPASLAATALLWKGCRAAVCGRAQAGFPPDEGSSEGEPPLPSRLLREGAAGTSQSGPEKLTARGTQTQASETLSGRPTKPEAVAPRILCECRDRPLWPECSRPDGVGVRRQGPVPRTAHAQPTHVWRGTDSHPGLF